MKSLPMKTMLAFAVACALHTGLASAAEDFNNTGDFSLAAGESKTYGSITVDGHKFSNEGTLTADTIDLHTNSHNAPNLKGKITANNSFIYRGTEDNYYTAPFETELTTELLHIKNEANQEVGFSVADSKCLQNVKKIKIETTGGKTGITVLGDIQLSNVELAGAKNARIEVFHGSATIENLTVNSDKATLQINNQGTFNIANLTVVDGKRANIETYKTAGASTGQATYNLGTVDVGADAKLTASLYGSKQVDVIYEGAPVFKLASGSVVDIAGAEKYSDNPTSHAEIKTDSLTIVAKAGAFSDETKAPVIYVPKEEYRNTGSSISVVSEGANNTGNAASDLQRLSTIVKETTTDTTGVSGVQVTQQAGEIYDSATGTVEADGTVSQVQTNANTKTHGLSQMTALAVQIWRNEINDMNKRLGELRDSGTAQTGAWTRVYSGKARFGEFGIKNHYTAFQFGLDRQVTDGLWLGGALSYTDGDSDFDHGDGESSLYAFTAYGSWLSENGLYLDVTGKIGRMKNSTRAWNESGITEASYHTNTFSMSAETGWRFHPMQNAFFIEPQLELMYGRVSDVSYTTTAGVRVDQESTDTLIGRAGGAVGFNLPDNLGNVYVRTSVLHDWRGDAAYRFTLNDQQTRIKESLSDTWYEFGIGANLNAGKNLHVYADLESSNGGDVDTDYRLNIGVRYAW